MKPLVLISSLTVVILLLVLSLIPDGTSISLSLRKKYLQSRDGTIKRLVREFEENTLSKGDVSDATIAKYVNNDDLKELLQRNAPGFTKWVIDDVYSDGNVGIVYGHGVYNGKDIVAADFVTFKNGKVVSFKDVVQQQVSN